MKEKKAKLIIKFIAGIIVLAALIVSLPLVIYLKVLPFAVSNGRAISYIENILEKSLEADVDIKNPKLITSLSPDLYFGFDSFKLSDKNKSFLDIEDFKIKISLVDALKKKITIKNSAVKYAYVDVNKVLDMPVMKTENEQPQQQGEWVVDIFQSVLNVEEADIIYTLDKNTSIKIDISGLQIDDDVLKKKVNYNVSADIAKGKNKLHITTSDGGQVYLLNKEKFVIENSEIFVNNHKINLKGFVDSKSNYDISLNSQKFSIPYVIDLLNSQIVPNNIGEMLVYFKDINGDFNFNVKLDNKNMNGDVDLNTLSFKLIPFMDLPILLNKGKVNFDNNRITLKSFGGYYNGKPSNKMDFEGTVEDYLKSVDTNLTGSAVVTNDFAQNYMSKMANCPISMKGQADTKIKLKSKNNKIDLHWIYWFKQGNGFVFDGSESVMNDSATRVLGAKMTFENMLLNIQSINYYAVNDKIDRANARIPILSMNGNIDFSNGQTFVKDFGLELPKPMPSGFLNFLLKQRLFRKGTFTGKMQLVNTGKYPVLSGNMKIDKVGIPSQRLFINNAELKTTDSYLNINSDGRFRGSKYLLKGKFVNEIKFPIIVKFAELDIDNIDVERYLRIFNNQAPGTQTAEQRKAAVEQAAEQNISEDANDDAATFDLANLIIEKCIFKIGKGFYKDINFSNVKANMTLDKNSVLKLDSNKFDIAEGTSSADIVCDLKNHLYKMRLALIQVNSDLIATSLLNLPREINGKASGLIELNTDNSLKLNGRIQFRVYEGVIAKIGLVEYAMKVASLFRNPLTMVSPTIINDLVSIPEGKFDQIDGELKLKDNVVQPMMIKSSSPQLSSYIIGTYNLETSDAALRIYTKFSNSKKGVYGFLRNLSLNSLANRIPLSSRNDSNYYEAEISQLPAIEADEKDCQIFLTKVDGDLVQNNFLSSLKKIK